MADLFGRRADNPLVAETLKDAGRFLRPSTARTDEEGRVLPGHGPEITVKKTTYTVPMTVTGVDDEGRTTVICPQCYAPGHVEPNGRVICSDWQPLEDFIAAEYERLRAALDV